MYSCFASTLARFGRLLMIAMAALTSWHSRAAPGTQAYGWTPGIAFTLPTGNVTDVVDFTCVGTPTCNGIYSYAPTLGSQCTGVVQWTGDIEIAGLALDAPGSLAGTMTLRNLPAQISAPPACAPVNRRDVTFSYTGTWDGTRATTRNATSRSGGVFVRPTPAPPPPAFPVTVTATITPTAANATAQFQPRPQDVGTTASVFVFAHVPASSIGVATAKNGGDYCVLAQLSPGGNLVAVSASSLQAYLTGVLGAQGNSVNILTNVPTPNVAGASFYIGYGPNAGAMFSTGTFQGVLNIPGTLNCHTNVAANSVPTLPLSLSGLWFNPQESGWGINFTQRRNSVFAAWYNYDSAGTPKWYVSSDCRFPSPGATSGTCSGSLLEVTGPPFFFPTFDPSRVAPRSVGTLQVNFANPNSATMTYNVNGSTRTVPIVRQVFQAAGVPAAVDYTDLWYNPAESGWGMSISHQYGTMFLAWYVYDASGRPIWYVASNCTVNGNSCSGPVYRTTGPPLGPVFDPGRVSVVEAGTILVVFTDANNAVIAYTVRGASGPTTKAITRQVF